MSCIMEKLKSLACARQVINYSSISQTDRFDKKSFNGPKLLAGLSINSPKMLVLLENIQRLDSQDYYRDKKLYKHFIYSSVQNGYGSKIIASVMVAAGYNLILEPKGSRVIINENKLVEKDEGKLALLSSTSIWNTPSNPKLVKEILKVFNSRPENTNGELVRFIIADSGFKEGVDLFDVKYVHIFEDQLTQADITQSWGRALRYCGQKGLEFKKNKGWNVEIFNYSLFFKIPMTFIDKKENVLNYIQKENKDLLFRSNFEKSLVEILKESSVDYDLNKNTHIRNSNFSTTTKIVITSAMLIASGLAIHKFGLVKKTLDFIKKKRTDKLLVQKVKKSLN